jgi:hypothetical protein
MTQTRLGSLIEATAGTIIGFVIALISQIVVFPLVGIHVPISTNLEIGFYFTLISVARGYVLRRWFNARLHAASQRLASKVQQ